MLIAFEGIHNSGKSTVINMLKERLINKGKKVYVSEWNSHPIVKDILYELRDSNQLCNSLLFFYMQMLDFVYRYELDVKPKLEEGYIVIMDRYVLTARLRGKMRNVGENIIHSICKNMKTAEYCFLLNVSVEKSINRGLPNDNSIWQAGFGITQFDKKFNLKGYYEYLSMQQQLYIDYAKEEKSYIIENYELEHMINTIISIIDE